MEYGPSEMFFSFNVCFSSAFPKFGIRETRSDRVCVCECGYVRVCVYFTQDALCGHFCSPHPPSLGGVATFDQSRRRIRDLGSALLRSRVLHVYVGLWVCDCVSDTPQARVRRRLLIVCDLVRRVLQLKFWA